MGPDTCRVHDLNCKNVCMAREGAALTPALWNSAWAFFSHLSEVACPEAHLPVMLESLAWKVLILLSSNNSFFTYLGKN